jgi:hypothetical protein
MGDTDAELPVCGVSERGALDWALGHEIREDGMDIWTCSTDIGTGNRS